jgi:RNA polymerase sigma-70 factor (ECF subfamily)
MLGDIVHQLPVRAIGESMGVSCSSVSDLELIRSLRAGNEEAFVAFVQRHNDSLLCIARSFVPNSAVAEEVVQDTWMAVVRGISKFEGRSSLRSWVIGILVNRARSTGTREHRSVPVATHGAAVDARRFDEDVHLNSPPQHFTQDVEDRMTAWQLSQSIRSLLEDLPAIQRQVVTLRDIEGLSGREVCELLGISEGNQRILLFRGRSRLRNDLKDEIEGKNRSEARGSKFASPCRPTQVGMQ